MEWRTAFVGREREIAEVRSLLEGTRLLTLTGPGGIGKTRLATEAIGAEWAGPRRVVVELASVRDPDQLLPAIGAALGLRESSAVDALHVLSERLGRRKSLLLLDNFEQIASAGPIVGTLLDATPSLRAMVTSRVSLHVSGEQVYPVPPLATPPDEPSRSAEEVSEVESVRLFVERARSVRPDFELGRGNAAAVAEICRRLDGLPLAIELAASRLKVLSPEAILKRLGQRLGLLTGGAADVPARQRTLRATIAWSYELLPPRERELLSRCAVFSGGFGLDGAQAVAADGESEAALLEALGVLVDHNLVTASVGGDGEPRFGILETIREFALAELPTAEATAIRDRHAHYCIQLAEAAEERLQGFEHARWLARLNEDVDNIRLARAWLSEAGDVERLARLAAAMGTYWRYYGSINEGRTWLGEALERSQEASPSTRAAVTLNAGWLEAVWGDLARGKDLLEQALVLYEEVDHPRRTADTLYHLGSTEMDLGELAASRSHLERGLALAKGEGDAALEGRLLYGLGHHLSWTDQSKFADRSELFLASIDASKRAGDIQRVALALGSFGYVGWDSGDRQVAVERWTESVRLLREWGERAFLGSFLLIKGFGERMTGRLEDSRQSNLGGLRLIREAGAMPDIVECLAEVVMWLHLAGAEERARATWMAVEKIVLYHGIKAENALTLLEARKELGNGGPPPSLPADSTGSASVEQALDAAEHDLATTPIRQAGPGEAPRSRFDLTPREREVLELVVAGHTNAQIGEALFISRKTASVHVANIKEKLAADSRVGIVTIALDRGLVGRTP